MMAPSKPTIGVSIMRAPWSKARCYRVASMLRVLPNATIIDAQRGLGVWHTAKRAWEAATAETTHHLVLQDDAILSARFSDHLAAVLMARPHHVVSLFTNRTKALARAMDLRSSWLWAAFCPYGVGVVMPSEWVGAMLDWCAEHVVEAHPHSDTRVSLWARASGLGVWTPAPPLLDHGAAPSLLGHTWPKPRLALAGGGDIDWSQGLDAPVIAPSKPIPREALCDPSEVERWPKNRF